MNIPYVPYELNVYHPEEITICRLDKLIVYQVEDDNVLVIVNRDTGLVIFKTDQLEEVKYSPSKKVLFVELDGESEYFDTEEGTFLNDVRIC